MGDGNEAGEPRSRAKSAGNHGSCALAVALLLAVVLSTLPYIGYRDRDPIVAIVIIAAALVSILHIRKHAGGIAGMLAFLLIPVALLICGLAVYLDYVIAGYRGR